MLPEPLAREIIASHQQRPRHRGALPGAPTSEVTNPGCGDRLSVWARLDGDVLAELSFEGQGCAISQASASLMTVALRGKTRAEAAELAARFRRMVLGEAGPDELEALGDLQALSGVSRLLARRRCALLAWRALDELLGTDRPGSDPAARPAATS